MKKIRAQKDPNLHTFNLHLSELIMEVEGIKLKAERSDIDGIKEHLERMNSLLVEIVDAKLNLVEKPSEIANYLSN